MNIFRKFINKNKQQPIETRSVGVNTIINRNERKEEEYEDTNERKMIEKNKIYNEIILIKHMNHNIKMITSKFEIIY